jgi:hypothetical protein
MVSLGTFAEEGIVAVVAAAAAADDVVVVGQQRLECQHLNCRNPSEKVDVDADQLEGEIKNVPIYFCIKFPYLNLLVAPILARRIMDEAADGLEIDALQGILGRHCEGIRQIDGQ